MADPPKGESPLHVFMRHTWHIVEPRDFVDGRHLHAKCEVLTEVHTGGIRDLVLNESPGSCKSLLVNVFWPAFIWLEHDPKTAMAFASYDIDLVNRDARRFVELLTSPLVRNAYPEFELDPNQSITEFMNSEKGARFGTSPGRKFTGRHYDGHVYDDLIKPQAILANVAGAHQKALQEAERWVKQTASNRAKDPEKLWRVLIAQRLHELDPSGVLLSEGGWEHLCFPERFEPNATWIIGGLTKRFEWRTEPGELLWPERRGEKAVTRSEKNLGSQADIDAQLQQNPSPTTGGVIDRGRLSYYDYDVPHKLKDCRVITSWDLSFGKEQVENSRCAWHLWAETPDGFYDLLDAGAAHLSYTKAKAKVLLLQHEIQWNEAQTWLVEDKANGTALMSDLEDVLNMQPFQPGAANKVERMLPHIELIHGGKVRFPKDRNGRVPSWCDEVLTEICKVPRGTYDDHFDCMSQALSYLVHGAVSYKQALKGWQQLKGQLL